MKMLIFQTWQLTRFMYDGIIFRYYTLKIRVSIMATLTTSANQIATSTLFISDLHLNAKNPEITNTFFYFLDHIANEADALYILGDFFESYIGDDEHTPFIT